MSLLSSFPHVPLYFIVLLQFTPLFTVKLMFCFSLWFSHNTDSKIILLNFPVHDDMHSTFIRLSVAVKYSAHILMFHCLLKNKIHLLWYKSLGIY